MINSINDELNDAVIKDIVKDFQNILDGKPSEYWDLHDENGNLEKQSEFGKRIGE